MFLILIEIEIILVIFDYDRLFINSYNDFVIVVVAEAIAESSNRTCRQLDKPQLGRIATMEGFSEGLSMNFFGPSASTLPSSLISAVS
jgi:hypothetical protein